MSIFDLKTQTPAAKALSQILRESVIEMTKSLQDVFVLAPWPAV